MLKLDDKNKILLIQKKIGEQIILGRVYINYHIWLGIWSYQEWANRYRNKQLWHHGVWFGAINEYGIEASHCRFENPSFVGRCKHVGANVGWVWCCLLLLVWVNNQLGEDLWPLSYEPLLHTASALPINQIYAWLISLLLKTYIGKYRVCPLRESNLGGPNRPPCFRID